MRKIIYISFLLATLFQNRLYADPQEDAFSKANELFTAGKTSEALDQWMTIYDQGFRSAELSYNIGNAHFKLNNIPESILFYERALLLSPGDEDINYNLGIARTFVIDRFDEIPELFFIRWFDYISLSLSTNKWAIISITAFILFLAVFSVFIYSSKYSRKVIAFWVSVALIILSSSSLIFSIRNKNLVYYNNNAIITSPVVTGKSSPDMSGTDLFVLHEGTKVSVEDELGGWLEVRLSDGNIGWVTSDCLNKL